MSTLKQSIHNMGCASMREPVSMIDGKLMPDADCLWILSFQIAQINALSRAKIPVQKIIKRLEHFEESFYDDIYVRGLSRHSVFFDDFSKTFMDDECNNMNDVCES